MAFTKNNIWAFRSNDGRSRLHIPPSPLWTAFLRLAQILVAILVVILTGLVAAGLGTTDVPGFEMAWFSFAWTVLYFAWLFIAVLFQPAAYHYWAHIAIEALTCIWWLVSFALLASEASALAEYERDIGQFNDFWYFYLYGASASRDSAKAVLDCTKAAAGIGALEWALFCATLVFLVISILNHRKAEAGPRTTFAREATSVEQSPPQQTVQVPPNYRHSVPPVYDPETPGQHAYRYHSEQQEN